MGSSYHLRRRWLLAVLFNAEGTGATPLEAAILSDMLTSYSTHEPTTCTPENHASSTSFTFSYPGLNSDSDWDPSAAGFEESLFSAMMTHTDSEDPKKDWKIRIGSGGNMYSHFVPTYGETMSPQSPERPFVDEVSQIVAVNLNLNQKVGGSKYCPSGTPKDSCPRHYVHQSGAYPLDSPYTDSSPVFSPALARHCQDNYCMFASWGTHAHVPTPFTSPIIYVTKFTNCGGGVIEHTQMVHNFAPEGSFNYFTNHNWFNVGWGGVRPSNLPYAIEPDRTPDANGDHALDYADPNTVNYLPLCRWGEGPTGLHSSRSVERDLGDLGGYTTFVSDGLLVNRDVTLELPCRVPTGCRNAEDTCMVPSCTDEMIADGYKRLVLGTNRDPECKFHNVANPFGGYVAMQCNLARGRDFGQTRPYASNTDPCAPWKSTRIGFKNLNTGATLEVAFVRHWSWSRSNWRVYFSVFVPDDGGTARQDAIDMVNSMFAWSGSVIQVALTEVYMSDVKPWCRKPNADCATDPQGCMVASCTDYQVEAEGYERIELAIPPGGPDCAFDPDNTYGGYVGLSCHLRKTAGFGALDAPEEESIGLYRTHTGMTLRIMHVKHWSKDPADDLVYFSTEIPDDGGTDTARQQAIDNVNALFENTSGDYIPLEIRALGPPPTIVPPDYDPDSLQTFTNVYGKGLDYVGSAVGGKGRRRIGSTTRDYTVFTTVWLNGANLGAGQTYQNRQFMVSTDLGSVKATADALVPKTNADKIPPQDWDPRAVRVYEDGGSFAVVASSEVEGTATSCLSLTAICEGTSTPKSGHVPFFHASCSLSSGVESYFGPNPLHFAPAFGSSFPDHADVIKVQHCIKIATTSPGKLAVMVNAGEGLYTATLLNTANAQNEVIAEECFPIVASVRVSNSQDEWEGTILLSTDDKVSYSPMVCDGCSGASSTDAIVVGSGATAISQAATKCLDGEWCALSPKRQQCLLVKTGDVFSDRGYVEVSVDSGNGYVIISAEAPISQMSEVVVDQCFDEIVGVRLRNGRNNAWVGTVRVSYDNKVTYNSIMSCTEGCTGAIDQVESIFVTGRSGGTAWAPFPTHCLNGDTCTLSPATKCILITTDADGGGHLDVLANAGEGLGLITVGEPNKKYLSNEVVLDHCFNNLLDLQVRSKNNDGWSGSIMMSTDNKASYSAMTSCDGCTGSDSGTSIVVDGNGDADGSSALTQCLDGNTCTFPVNLVCLIVETGPLSNATGPVHIFVDSGSGHALVNDPNVVNDAGSIVVDQCFNEVKSVQVKNTDTDTWVGSLKVSTDNKLSYTALNCDDCSGDGSAESLVVQASSDGANVAPTHCLNGETCTLSFHTQKLGTTMGTVRSYACKNEKLERPSWKLMGFFDPNDAGCAALETSTYDQSICTLF